MSGKYRRLIGLPAVGLAPAAATRVSQPAEQQGWCLPWWVWLLLILLAAFLFVLWWWWWRPRSRAKVVPPAPEPPKPYVPAKPAPTPEMPVVEKLPVAEVKVPEKPALPVAEVKVPEKPAPVVVVPVPAKRAPDDLAIVEGIGPKIASLFQAAGITTFAQLAATDVARLRHILRAADIRIADPTTWPEQARLAAAGEWDKLKALQEQLKGGRRV